MVVIDASVIFKWCTVEEPDFEVAAKIFENHVFKKETIIVPSILLYEITNALVTKTKIAIKEITAYLKQLQEAQIQVKEINFNFAQKVVVFAKKYQVTVYDASYAVLAKEKKCHLITADKKFVNQINLPFVKYLGEVDVNV